MPSQFFGLNIAYKGLLASNAALNTTSNNIANVQTEGYSRQKVVQQASDALRIFQTYGCAGAGVDTIAIERIRDEFYDNKYWSANTVVGEYSIKQYYMAQVETYFKDDVTTQGFTTIFGQFSVTGIQEVLKAAGTTAGKAQFVGYADNLTEYFNGMYSNLQKVQKDVNQELKLKVDEINSLSSEIASLSKQINVIELTGSKANELRDRRTLLLDQLSQIVNIETQEIPITDANNPERETGAYRFLVKIGGGQLLIDTSDYKQLECVARPSYKKMNQTDIDGLYDVYWADGEQFNLYDRTLGGSLQGLVEMRDGNNEENFYGTVVGTDRKTLPNAKGEPVTHDTVKIQVSQSYLKDLNKCNLSDSGGLITLGNQEFYYDSWSYTCDYDNKDAYGNPTYTYEFVLSEVTKDGTAAEDGRRCNTRNLTNDRITMEAEIGASIDYQGIPYYMAQMNEWVRTFAQKANDIMNQGYDIYGNAGCDLFAAKKTTDKGQWEFDEAFRYDHQTSGKMTVDVASESYYLMTAGNFSILAALVNDADMLATKGDPSDGVDNYDNINALKDMINDKTKMSYRGCKAGEFLECILSDVALNASNANIFCDNYKTIASSIDNQRISISGVDEDEEAVNLIKYQNGYTLASKMIQTLTEVYDRLILETGV